MNGYDVSIGDGEYRVVGTATMHCVNEAGIEIVAKRYLDGSHDITVSAPPGLEIEALDLARRLFAPHHITETVR